MLRRIVYFEDDGYLREKSVDIKCRKIWVGIKDQPVRSGLQWFAHQKKRLDATVLVGPCVAQFIPDRIWWALESADWLEAFDSHPKIGEKKAAASVARESLSWSEKEQSGTRDSTQQTMEELAELNRKYQEKFGFIYIVCATGKSAEEMLAILRERLNSNAATELHNAAQEQAKITTLRLNKLIEA